MSFMRPEVALSLSRWREALIGVLVAGVGIWFALVALGPVGWIGWILALVGAALIGAGIQRGRFRVGRDGPGVVRVDEGQIAYFGPWNGGIAALSELDRIVLDRRPQTPNWQLHQPGRRELEIPVTAEGAEALFDAFSALPGFDTRVMLAALHAVDQKRTEIWERPALRLH